MATALRRRPVVHEESPSPTPTPTDTPRTASPAREEKEKKIHVVHHKPRTRKRRNTFIFLLGSLSGIIAAGFAKTNDLIDFPEIGDLGMSMDSLLDVLPAGLVKDMSDLVVSDNGVCQLFLDKCRPLTRKRCHDFTERRTRFCRQLFRALLGRSQSQD